MTPYYQDSAVTIYHGDCREVLPTLDQVGSVVTDPVWPNTHPDFNKFGSPQDLWDSALALLPNHDQLVVWLGCMSDPRFLCSITKPFVRQVFIEYSVPRIRTQWCLITHDAVYLFGKRPDPRDGYKVLPGRYFVRDHRGDRKSDHPCERSLPAAKYVIDKLTEPGCTVLDPFMGVGTIIRASKDHGRKAIGIEIEERYCEIAAKRMAQEVMDLA